MSKTTRGAKRRTKAEWIAILDRFRSSGLTRMEFCRREGVPLSSLQRWQRRLGSEVSEGFVELAPGPTPATSPWELEIALPNGVQLRFRG